MTTNTFHSTRWKGRVLRKTEFSTTPKWCSSCAYKLRICP